MSRITQPIQCIGCPVGCGGDVIVENGEVVEMHGFNCDVGQAYAAEEVIAPKRMVTTTVRLKGGALALLPVVSAKPIPKGRIFDCVNALRKIEVVAPVKAGDVVLADVLGVGVDMVAARSVAAN
jgi:CxxC motif-containing protein